MLITTTPHRTRIACAVRSTYLPQRFVAAKIGIHPRILERYMSGEIKPAPLREVAILAAIHALRNPHIISKPC